jgi:hypothetical protein
MIGVFQVFECEAVAPGVKLIGKNWMPDVGQVDPDLVGPPALRLAAHQGEIAESFLDFIERHGVLAAVRGGSDGHLLSRDRMKADWLFDVVAVPLGDAVNDRQIFLVNLTELKLSCEPAMGQLVLDDDQ